MKGNGTGRIYGLDGLRALAIIGVTLFHMFPGVVRGGYMGVCLFFVISGYLLARTGEKRYRREGFSVVSFYLKRVERIYPALLLALLISAGVFFFAARDTLAGVRPELLSILLSYNNWWQIAQNADYFARINNASPFTHMWFLAVELQFYLIWPLIYLAFRWLRERWGRAAGLGLLLVLTLVSGALMPILYRPEMDVTRLYYGSDSRWFALLLGVLIGMLQDSRMIPVILRKIARRWAIPISALFLILTVIIFITVDGQMPFVYRGGMFLITLLFGVMVLFVTDRKIPVGRWLEAEPLVWIGQRSYEMYLWQYPVIFLFLTKGWNTFPGSHLIQLALIVLLAAWLHFLVSGVLQGWLLDEILHSPLWRGGLVGLAGLLSVFLFFAGILGVGTAAAEKFPQVSELADRLAENQRMLEELQNGEENVEEVEVPGESETAEETTAAVPAIDVSSFEYADPTLTNAAPVSLSKVLMIGDSIMLDASPNLKEELPDCYIDAVQNRRPIQCLEVGQQLIYDGRLHQTVVVSLGTNVPITVDTATRIMNMFGPEISVFWVNLHGKTVDWEDESNQNLLDLTKTFPNLSVIDWKSIIENHPEWMWQDGDHPNLEGSAVYAQLIRESLEAALANQSAQ